MNTTIFFSKLFVDACRDTLKVCQYFELRKNNNLFVFLKIFIIKFFYAFEKLRNRNRPNLKFIVKKRKFFENLILEDKINLRETVIDLDINGFSKIHRLNDDITDKILYESLKLGNFDIKKLSPLIDKKNLAIKEKENLNAYIDRLNLYGISRLTKTIDLNNENLSVNKIIFSEEVLSIATSYLNTKELSINATFFISNSLKTSEEEKYKNAQYFHWDNDFTKFFKLYIYLNDVTLQNGPHIFIPKTHKLKKKENKLCRLFSDENINRNYQEKKIFLGKKGSMFFVDSYGIHKGETPQENYRLMLNIHFGRGKILYSNNDKYIKLN